MAPAFQTLHQDYCFFPGEFFHWETPCLASYIGRIVTFSQNTLSVSQWDVVPPSADVMDSFCLPPILVDSGQLHVIPTPSMFSLVFVFNKEDFSTFKIRYIHGMRDVFCTMVPYRLYISLQSLSNIIFTYWFTYLQNCNVSFATIEKTKWFYLHLLAVFIGEIAATRSGTGKNMHV